MDVLARAVEHYGALPKKKIKVPEWGPEGEPLVIYSTALSVADREKIRQIGNMDSPELHVDLLIYHAQDDTGALIFDAKDRHDLTHSVDSRIVSRIALNILAGPSDEDLEKN